jgi:ATP/maltotriose-dependent transcriptional regulator MalT
MPSAYSTDGAAEEVGLTGREIAVLGLVAEGLTATAVGNRLAISARTVEKHLERAYSKLHCDERITAVLRAQSLGLLPPRILEKQ